MKKGMRKVFCALLGFVSACSFAGCRITEVIGASDISTASSSECDSSSSSQAILDSDFPLNSDSETDSSAETSDEDLSEEGVSTGWQDVPPPPTKPDTVLLREDLDAFGHKIAYYTDGTWVDLGRAVPLDFTPRAAASRYGYTQLRLEKNAAGKQNLYNQFFEAALAFDQSSIDVKAETVQGGDFYPIAKIDCSGYGISYETQQKVWRTFRQDCPEFYFIGSQFCKSGDTFWLCIDGEYAKHSERERLRTAIQNAALECDSYLNGFMDETELALTINDYLTSKLSYNDVDKPWAHNLVGWATKNAGVCEAYAESYAYLCDLFGVECWTVTGADVKTGVGHAWNILQIDGEWHNVDVTWNDGFEQTAPQFIDRKWFGMGADEFALTHQADLPTGEALAYQVPLPKLSKTTLQPVRLLENGQWSTLLPTIEDAMEKLVNVGSMYEIILYPDTNAQVKLGTIVYPQGASFPKTTIPKTAGLTISAKRYKVSEYTYIPATLDVPETVVLQGDLTLKDLTWMGKTIQAVEGELTVMDGVELNLDSLIGTIVRVDAQAGYAVLNGRLDVDTVEIASGIWRVRDKAEINRLQLRKGTALYHLTAENLTVDLVDAEEGSMIYTAEKTKNSVVSLGMIMGAPFALRVDFIGTENYPTVKLTGSILSQLNLVLGGRTSDNGGEAITPDMMQKPIAVASIHISTEPVRVYFIQGNTAHEVAYSKDAGGNLTVNP